MKDVQIVNVRITIINDTFFVFDVGLKKEIKIEKSLKGKNFQL